MKVHIGGKKNMKSGPGDDRRYGEGNIDAVQHKDRSLRVCVWGRKRECGTISKAVRLMRGAIHAIRHSANLYRGIGNRSVDGVCQVVVNDVFHGRAAG